MEELVKQKVEEKLPKIIEEILRELKENKTVEVENTKINHNPKVDLKELKIEKYDTTEEVSEIDREVFDELNEMEESIIELTE